MLVSALTSPTQVPSFCMPLFIPKYFDSSAFSTLIVSFLYSKSICTARQPNFPPPPFSPEPPGVYRRAQESVEVRAEVRIKHTCPHKILVFFGSEKNRIRVRHNLLGWISRKGSYFCVLNIVQKRISETETGWQSPVFVCL